MSTELHRYLDRVIIEIEARLGGAAGFELDLALVECSQWQDVPASTEARRQVERTEAAAEANRRAG